MNAVRLPALVVIITLITGAFIFQVQTEEEVSQSKEPLAYSELSFGLPLEETSGDVWFCLGPTNKLDGVDDQIISITNLSSKPQNTKMNIKGKKIRNLLNSNIYIKNKKFLKLKPFETIWLSSR